MEVITEISLGQSVVSVRHDCPMEGVRPIDGVRLPANPTMARYALAMPRQTNIKMKKIFLGSYRVFPENGSLSSVQ